MILKEMMGKDCNFAYVVADQTSQEMPFFAQQLSGIWAGVRADVSAINGYTGAVPLSYPGSFFRLRLQIQNDFWEILN